MGRSNKIDIVAADTLEPEHAVCQLLFGDWITFSLMADIIILAVHTAQITICEEHSTRTSNSSQMVRTVGVPEP